MSTPCTPRTYTPSKSSPFLSKCCILHPTQSTEAQLYDWERAVEQCNFERTEPYQLRVHVLQCKVKW